MSHLEVLETRLERSKYEPVIWEDVEPLEERVEKLEGMVIDLLLILQESGKFDSGIVEQLKNLPE
jgi:tetrahydromethanopterin S-methyltransferase subunit B